MEFKDRLAAYFIRQAEWRDYKAGEYRMMFGTSGLPLVFGHSPST